MKKFFTIDAHEDIAFHLSFHNRNFVNPNKPCMITLPWLKESGIRVVFNTIFVYPTKQLKNTEASKRAMLQLDIYDKIYKEHPKSIFQINNTSDLKHLKDEKKIGFLTLMEGADPIREPNDLYKYHERGVRLLGPTWNNKNIFASGSNTNEGLTLLGRELIKIMNELSITLDLSHLNEKSFWDSIELTDLIPIATHSNARTLTDHPRNLKDEQLKAISNLGGVIGIVFYNEFLKINSKPPSLEEIYKHTEYILNICGEDHVGIGTDLDGARIKDFPKEIRQISNLPRVSEYFIKKGYSNKTVEKIMGKNFLRVIKNNLNN